MGGPSPGAIRPAGGSPLPEVPEARATGATADCYADIRAVTGAPMVNLVYRHLAARGDELFVVWDILRPLFVTGKIQAAAAKLPAPVDRLPRTRVAAAVQTAGGIESDARAALAARSAAYTRANRMNLVAFSALLSPPRSAAPSATGRAWPLPAWPAALPPVMPLDSAPQHTTVLLHRLGSAHSGSGDRFIPTFYRHLAHWPGALHAAWELVERSDSDETTRAAALLSVSARVLAAELGVDPSRPGKLPADVVAVIDTFCDRIAEMLVVIRLLEHLQTPLRPSAG